MMLTRSLVSQGTRPCALAPSQLSNRLARKAAMVMATAPLASTCVEMQAGTAGRRGANTQQGGVSGRQQEGRAMQHALAAASKERQGIPGSSTLPASRVSKQYSSTATAAALGWMR